jgi:hypothetical protein
MINPLVKMSFLLVFRLLCVLGLMSASAFTVLLFLFAWRGRSFKATVDLFDEFIMKCMDDVKEDEK